MLTRVNDQMLMLPAGATVVQHMFDVIMYREFEIMTFEFPLKNVIVVGPMGQDIEFETFEDAIEAIEGVN